MRFLVDYAVRGITYNESQKGYIIALAIFSLLGVIGVPLYHKKLKKGCYDS